MLLLTAPVLVFPMVAVMVVNKGVSARLVILVALALVVAGNYWLMALRPENTVAVVTMPLLMIGVGMGASFGITDGQAMNLVPADSVGMAAGFLNTLRGAAEALVIAVVSAAILGFLSGRLGDADHAAAVGSGRLGARPGAEIDAFTYSWRMTQFGVGTLCLILGVLVAILILRPGKTGDRVRSAPPLGGRVGSWRGHQA